MALIVPLNDLIAEKAEADGRKLTQKIVAEEIGVDPGTLSRYANGFTRSVSTDVLEKLMTYFNKPIERILVHRPG